MNKKVQVSPDTLEWLGYVAETNAIEPLSSEIAEIRNAHGKYSWYQSAHLELSEVAYGQLVRMRSFFGGLGKGFVIHNQFYIQDPGKSITPVNRPTH